MYKFLDTPLMLHKSINITKEEAREVALKQVIFLCQSGYFNVTDMKKNPELFLQRMEAGIIDASMNVKLGVQLLLFAGSIMNLGTKKHHDLYLKRAERCELPGAFAMTEIEHGSNVRELKTTAIFDEQTNEFVLNTPNKGAIKWWLGNAACHATMATVFARLILKGKDYGVHAFLCPIRDPKSMELLPGVIAGDCGDKIGLHGVDNGFLEFENVRIPYDNLLDRFGGIDLESKSYKSEFDSAGRRFAAVLGELITGRVTIVSGSLNCRRVGCMIATRYASQRTQFSAGKEFPEQPILDYKSHKTRLMPIIASSYVFEFIKRNVVKKYCRLHLEKVSDDELQEIHALSAGVKAAMSWDTQTHLQTLREMCGGHGYSAYNRLGTLRNDHDVLKTFEGDNTVLIQQLGGYLLKEFSKQFSGELISDSVQYIRKQVGGMAQRNPLITRLSSKKHLRNSDYHLQAFEYRTAKLLQECALEINVNKKKQGIFRAFGESLPKLIRLGRAYVEQVALHDYLHGIEQVQDPELKPILKMMGDLYALDIISKNVGDFIDLIKKNKLSAIHDMVEWLCEELRVHAVSLVDSFGFPDFLLDAPIAKRDHVRDDF
ncbi:peroxisomal acyl-CoA oxidase [Naegleria gruberi]|uniref:Acyl-coenzyme A oxidase n=1 Tax=Naegleria gruberi TaxID=5762 RepID=D2VTN0_NAEGR|nr:peroxisomal acyl-CoA oxidase [Naegleria gruberi]EFC39889.1 peroxisomal acyl-CoA oxidase [Naegleria gruberi]|eukprot:XP_002672633.1 peroxisomal acyl-CoA oxidase [Naegleria gruberi strain NEG-M]